jgi:tetratricopeptide (TPR) repeat protein
MTYDNRADAYTKTGSYDSAIDDYGKGIGLTLGATLLITPLHTLRAVYPELSNISDKYLIEGLRQKYNPALSASGFAEALQSNKGTADSTLTDNYVGRADAYLKSGKYRQAATDYQRAAHLIPSYSPVVGEDRWKEVTSDGGTTYSVDASTMDFSKAYPSLWLKSVASDGSSVMENYQFNCTSKEIKGVSRTRYDVAGNRIGSTGQQGWESVVPETVGETLYNGMCS